MSTASDVPARSGRFEIKLKHLQLFVALDEFRHLGRAAEFLHLTQPAVSRTLAAIEESLGAKLFTRSSRGTLPTTYGERILRYARQTLAEFDRVRDDLQSIDAGAAGRVNVGASLIAALGLLPRAIATLKQAAPRSVIRVEEGPVESLLPRLGLGEIDCIVGRLHPSIVGADLYLEPIYQDRIAVVASPDHPLVRRKRIEWADARRQAWVLPQPGLPQRIAMEATFSHHGLAMPADVVEMRSFVSAMAYLQERESLALLALSIARKQERLGALAVLPLALPHTYVAVGLVTLRNRPLTPMANRLAQALRRAGKAMETELGVRKPRTRARRG